MDLASPVQMSSSFRRLQRLARPQLIQQRCELCSAILAEDHQHLLEVKSRQLLCACDACALLFAGAEDRRYRRVPQRVTNLYDVDLAEVLLENLHIPINLAFFYRNSQASRLMAMYPSPAGATESLLPTNAWERIIEHSASLQNMQSDVESLLVNHVGQRRDCFLVSIDQCYKLAGLVRAKWRGLSGGREVWQAIEDFFDELHRRAGCKVGGFRRA